MWKIGSAFVDFDDRPVGKHALHAGVEDLPLLGAVEIVAHEESAAQQVFAQLLAPARR